MKEAGETDKARKMFDVEKAKLEAQVRDADNVAKLTKAKLDDAKRVADTAKKDIEVLKKDRKAIETTAMENETKLKNEMENLKKELEVQRQEIDKWQKEAIAERRLTEEVNAQVGLISTEEDIIKAYKTSVGFRTLVAEEGGKIIPHCFVCCREYLKGDRHRSYDEFPLFFYEWRKKNTGGSDKAVGVEEKQTEGENEGGNGLTMYLLLTWSYVNKIFSKTNL